MQYSVAILSLALMLLVGCRQDVAQSSAPGPAVTPPKSSLPDELRIERAKDLEEAFAAVDRFAWVFKHSGQRLTAKFEIFYRPAGAGAAEERVFQANADSLDVSVRQEEGDRDVTLNKGLLLVTVPNSFAKREGDVVFACTKSNVFARTTETSSRILPDTLPEGVVSGGGFAIDNPASLKPGETLRLAERTQHFLGGDADNRTLENCDRVRLALTVTALPVSTPSP